jgi:hypothetical protein
VSEREREQNTRTPQHDRRKEEGEVDLYRFGGSESVIFKLVIRNSRGWISTKIGEIVLHLEDYDMFQLV